ncbi:MAG: hypothetical protein ACJA2S_001935 [Cyclobacteriaceae bacterium]
MYRFEKSDYALTLLSAVILGLCLWDGPLITFDSNLYLKGSQHLNQFGFNELFSSGAFRAKPPFYPVLLSLIGNNITIATWTNLLFHILSLGLSFFLINELVQEKTLRLVTKGLVALGVPVILIHNFLLPESIFMFLWNVQLVMVYLILKKPSNKLFLLLTFSCLLMLGLRHIGIILIVPSSLFLVYHFRNSEHRIVAILNLSLPLLVFFTWQVLLFNKAGNLSRLDHFNGLDLLSNSYQVLLHFSRWFIPSTGVFIIDLVTSLVIVGCLGYLIMINISDKESKSFSTLSILIAITFLVFIALKGDLLLSDIERYLSLIYLPTLLLCISGLQTLKYRLGAKAFNLLLILWMIYPIGRLTKNVILWSGL